MPASSVDELLNVIGALPVRDRLKLVERVLHDITDSQGATRATRDPRSVIGSFADIADVMDKVAAAAMADRERRGQ